MGSTVDFWNRVNALIKEAKKTQNSLSIECGFGERRVNSLSASHIYPRTDEAVLIARALHTSVEYLVTGEEAAPPDMINRKEALAAVRALEDKLKGL